MTSRNLKKISDSVGDDGLPLDSLTIFKSNPVPHLVKMRRFAKGTAELFSSRVSVAQRADYTSTASPSPPPTKDQSANQAKQTPQATSQSESTQSNQAKTGLSQHRKKTMAELDEELKLKMEGMSGGGGSAGVEYENGKAQGLKRGVKDNMFRVI